jgi:KDO2-lipid IV(A) lauroyltransferase
LLAAYIIAQGVRLTIIARKPNYPRLANHLDQLRRRYGAEVIWRNEPKAAKKLLKAFKECQVVAALIDQDTDVQNDFAPFFSLEAAVPSAPIRFAVQRGIPVYSAFIARHARMKHLVFIEEIPYEHDDSGAVQEIIGCYNQRLEGLLRRYPEQWWWWHRRWRRRPEVDYAAEPEKLRSTRDYLLWLKEQTLTKHRPAAGQDD